MLAYVSTHWRPLIILFMGPIILTFLTLYFSPGEIPSNEAVVSAIREHLLIVTLSLTVSLASIGLIIEDIHKSINTKIDETANEFSKDFVKITRLKNNDIDIELNKFLAKASKVRNTYLNIHKNLEQNLQMRSTAELQYLQFLRESHRQWIDVTTLEGLRSGRYRRLLGSVNSVGDSTTHGIYIVSEHTESLNFIIVDSEILGRVVFFGWITHEHGDVEAFLTKDNYLVSLFENLFRRLVDGPSNYIVIDYSSTPALKESGSEALLAEWVVIFAEDLGKKIDEVKEGLLIGVGLRDGAWKVRVTFFNPKGKEAPRKFDSEIAITYGFNPRILFEGTEHLWAQDKDYRALGKLQVFGDESNLIYGQYISYNDGALRRIIGAKLEEGSNSSQRDDLLEKVIDSKRFSTAYADILHGDAQNLAK